MFYFLLTILVMNHILNIKDFFKQHFCDLISIKEINQQSVQISSSYPIRFLEKELKNQFPDIQFEFDIKIPMAPTQLPGYMIKNIQNTIAVVSGKGGVGKSTVSCNLAIATQRLGAQVGLLDADIYGPSIPTMMGLHEKPKITEDERYIPPKAFNVECMSMGLLQNEGPLIWRGPMLAKALIQMLDITAWSALDYLFLDLPPGTGDIPLSLIQKIPLSGAIIVTTPQTIATLDAEKAIEMFLKTNVPILGIIANMAWHECQNCHHQNFIFGQDGAHELAKRYQLPILAEIPLNGDIRQTSDQGFPIAAQSQHPLSQTWLNAALKTTQNLAERKSKFPPIRQG